MHIATHAAQHKHAADAHTVRDAIIAQCAAAQTLHTGGKALSGTLTKEPIKVVSIRGGFTINAVNLMLQVPAHPAHHHAHHN